MAACGGGRKLSLRHVAAFLAAGASDVTSPSTTPRGAAEDDDDDNYSSNGMSIVQRCYYLGRDSGGTTTSFHPPRRSPSWLAATNSHHALCEGGGRGAAGTTTESERFERALARHRSRITTYRKEWEYVANSSATTSATTPSRSWPDDVPPDDDISFLLEDAKYCDRSPPSFGHGDREEYCSRLRFRVASALLVQFEEASQKKGLEMLRTLAENNYSDAMVYYGMCLNDGRAGMEPNSEEAVSWFKRCSELHGHPQSQYELGVAFYTGEGVAENEEEAVRLFKLGAQQHHAAACYMLGDCLLDGVGVELDRATALEWLVLASELGHRGARSRVMAVLEKKEGEDYGVFTDASRQTLVEHIAPPAANKVVGQLVQRRTTLLRDVSGGSRDPTELARRQTIVGNSRKE